MIQDLAKTHESMYKTAPSALFFAPGRVNLIGEHTDYSGGFVFPAALDLGIYGAFSFREDAQKRIYSASFADLGVVTLDPALEKKASLGFANYVQAVLWSLKEEGYALPKGFDITLMSTLPDGAGLSSSAALEMLIGYMMNDVFALKLELTTLVRLAKKAENEYMGVASGIMDQFAVGFGKEDHGLFLNTQTLTFEHVPLHFENHTLILTNTNKKRALVDSAYNERFASVKDAGQGLAFALGQTPQDVWEAHKVNLSPRTALRGDHVVSENARTLAAVEALKAQDYLTFGALLVASHTSLKEAFEVSCEELDYLVEEHLALGALGARMTGAGFGGTMIALYAGDAPDFTELKARYQARFGFACAIYEASIASGVTRLR